NRNGFERDFFRDQAGDIPVRGSSGGECAATQEHKKQKDRRDRTQQDVQPVVTLVQLLVSSASDARVIRSKVGLERSFNRAERETLPHVNKLFYGATRTRVSDTL